MKERELRAASVCSVCKKKIGNSMLPMFYRVKIQKYVLDLQACQRQQGLGLMLGGALAQYMGPNEDLATKVSDIGITVCMTCASQSISVEELEDVPSVAQEIRPEQQPTGKGSPAGRA